MNEYSNEAAVILFLALPFIVTVLIELASTSVTRRIIMAFLPDVKCERCQAEIAATTVYPITTDETRSNGPGKEKLVCKECAIVLLETGDWESDD